MNIINTEFGHVIKTRNKKRPFRICKQGRLSSFSTVEAAEAALKRNIETAHEEVIAMQKAGVSC